LERCDELWVDGDSRGVRIEKEYAIKKNMPIRETLLWL